jgi:hypothetical protein
MTISVTSLYIYNHKNIKELKGLISPIIIILISGITLFPVVGLTIFHMGLVGMGRTTNEQVSGKFGGGHNPFNLGCYRNCCNVLFGPLPPRYLGYKAPKRKKLKSSSSSNAAGPDSQSSNYASHPLNTSHIQIEMEPMGDSNLGQQNSSSKSPKSAIRGGGWTGGLQMGADAG